MTGPIEVLEVQPGTPADKAGLRAKDKIVSVDGHPFHSVNSLLAYMQTARAAQLTLDVDRNGADVKLTAQPAKLKGTTYMLGFAAVPPPYHQDTPPFAAGGC